MARLQQVETAYDGLPRRPFPEEGCTVEMSEEQKAIFRTRIGKPIEALYHYGDAKMREVFGEFGLQVPSE